ncbi:hypothetical protein AB0I08_37780, partial [Streptomyces lavendulae]
LKKDVRHALVDGIYTAEAAAQRKGTQDTAYSLHILTRHLHQKINRPSGIRSRRERNSRTRAP